MNDVTFGVITKVPPDNDPEGGNLALAMPLYFRMMDKTIQDSVRALGVVAMSALSPVFTLGEILVLDTNGREVSGKGRKPGKWYVTCEEFATIDDAIKRAMEVSERDL